MKILGIETSCDETAASLLEVKNNKIKILSNVISSQVKLHAPYGGVVPSLAAREHVKNLPKVLKLALKIGNYKLENVDLVAVTRGPGLVSSLLVGTTFAQALAWKYKKPIIGVNHLEGHIASNWLPSQNLKLKIQNLKSQKNYSLLTTHYSLLPALCLIVSGGHTELILINDIGKYKVIGQTLDDAAGEAFDKIARILGLGYPGGPAIEKEAAKVLNKKLRLKIKLPRPMLKTKNLDFSFAGLKTAVLYLVRDLTKTYALSKIRTAVAQEAQQAIVDVLVTKTVNAAREYKTKSIMLSGGVSANKLLRQELKTAAEKTGLKFYRPELEYTTDNAAMIALAGFLNYQKNKKVTEKSIKVDANLKLG
ncbi:MAG: tRNA (adenosine(37)-N6)-threonylcarbamoyltransferase complex transferase subunit TsaD [Candidatus Yanofskybacteria bacterium]|nr:tRNA (adenosine(37)-N6)-threonylcarbamoyltransferase complex transferase subunit TsaD [Candidatus Yanofskybacteria bacterium]